MENAATLMPLAPMKTYLKAENHVTSKEQQWRIPVKIPSIQVRLSLIFPFILVRFACGLKKIPQKNDSNMPILWDLRIKIWLRSY